MSIFGLGLVVCVCLLWQSRYIGKTAGRGMQRLRFENVNMTHPCPLRKQQNSTLEDILCRKRPAFLPNYKNPCWLENSRLRCLPYFQIIGTPKSASTDMFERLAQHPSVVKNKGIFGKEIWYWSWKRYGYKGKTMTFDDFVNKFEAWEIMEGQVDGYHSLITGLGDPMDFTDFHWNSRIPQNDPNAEELVWTTPYLIKHINPDVRLILSLRDPIERLYSYYFFYKRGDSSRDFHDHIVNSMAVWYNCTTHHSHRHCLYDPDVRSKMKVSLHSSFYSSHLKEWLKVFRRDQIFVYRMEDYNKDIRGTLQLIFDFLNLDALPRHSMDVISQLPKQRVTKTKTHAGPMLMETKKILVEFYRNSTIELAELLSDKRFAFEDVSFTYS